MTSPLELSVRDFLERVAAREPAPGGGVVAAVTVAAASGLVAMAGRYSDDAVFESVVTEADRLRARAGALAAEDATAYQAVIAARRLPRNDPERKARIAEALGRATDVPLAIAVAARQAAQLGAQVARDGNRNLRGDALTGVLLADAAGRSAARLVEENVRLGGLDGDWLARARAACAELAAAVAAAEEAA